MNTTRKQGHTPGPWTVEKRKGTLGMVVTYGTVIISQVFTWGKKPDYKTRIESEANAALIAAAPELLAVLIECHEPDKHEADGCEVCALIERAGG